MSPSATEKTYETLKQALMEGRLAFGPLDIRRLGDRMRVSATPVREALARLACERFVAFIPQQGYSFAPPPASVLKDLYDLNGQLVALALAGLSPSQGKKAATASRAGAPPAELIRATLAAIASSQPNRELEDHVIRTSERLHLARIREGLVFRGVVREAVRLARLWDDRQVETLRTAVERYRRVRVRRSAEIALAIADPPPP